MSDMRLIVAGAGGRMGRALMRVITETPGAVVAGALEAPGSELLGKDAGTLAGLPANGVLLSADLWSMSAEADGILDFTVPGATIANVAIAAQRGLVHIIGTTGLSASDDAVIKSVTSRAIVVKSGNMSLGVNLLAALVKRVAQSLDESFDIEILEMHHRAKIDAPSGTALLLGEAAPRCCWARRQPLAAESRWIRTPRADATASPVRVNPATSVSHRCGVAPSPAITA
jgi:4-hydroxy-tetrahydrodipicolinate reductase